MSPISFSSTSNPLRASNLPDPSGPPRVFGPTTGFLGRRGSNAGSDSGNTNRGLNPGAAGTPPNVLISDIAQGDSGVRAEPAEPDRQVFGTARGDSSGNFARGEPNNIGIDIPMSAGPNKENQNAGFAAPRDELPAHFTTNTPTRSQEQVPQETERWTSRPTSMNIYKESQTMSFQNWPDVRGFEAWKNHFYREVASKSNEPKEVLSWLFEIETAPDCA